MSPVPHNESDWTVDEIVMLVFIIVATTVLSVFIIGIANI